MVELVILEFSIITMTAEQVLQIPIKLIVEKEGHYDFITLD